MYSSISKQNLLGQLHCASKMNRKLLILIVSVLLMGEIVQANVVCPQDYCSAVKCDVNPKSCPKDHILGDTFCGCCKRCVPEIREFPFNL